jgi:hypothetical protein
MVQDASAALAVQPTIAVKAIASQHFRQCEIRWRPKWKEFSDAVSRSLSGRFFGFDVIDCIVTPGWCAMVSELSSISIGWMLPEMVLGMQLRAL